MGGIFEYFVAVWVGFGDENYGWKQRISWNASVVFAFSTRSISSRKYVSILSYGRLSDTVSNRWCQLYQNFSKQLWDVISYMVSNVPLSTPGKDLVLFAIENCLLSVEAPPKDGLPHVEISFQPLV
ncbi:hypothetical protein OIU78_016901 [Salix suchowensis]|nr:hypothetical protein OIU78_016901 [Salix suchowensis]